MEVSNSDKQDAVTFANNLFADLMSLHPVLCELSLFSSKRQSSYDSVVGKCVTMLWFDIHDILKMKLRIDFPRFAQSQSIFREYLNEIVGFTLPGTDKIHEKVFVLSSTLLEVISFLYQRGLTDFIHYASQYWLFMFKEHIDYKEFYKQGGWNTLKLVAKKEAEDYDANKDQFYTQYYLKGSTFTGTSGFNSGKISEKLQEENSTEISGEKRKFRQRQKENFVKAKRFKLGNSEQSAVKMPTVSPTLTAIGKDQSRDDTQSSTEAICIQLKNVKVSTEDKIGEIREISVSKEDCKNEPSRILDTEKSYAHEQATDEIKNFSGETLKNTSPAVDEQQSSEKEFDGKTIIESEVGKFDFQMLSVIRKDQVVIESNEKKVKDYNVSNKEVSIVDETLKLPKQRFHNHEQDLIRDILTKKPQEETYVDSKELSAQKKDINEEILKKSKNEECNKMLTKRDFKDKISEDLAEKETDYRAISTSENRCIDDKQKTKIDKIVADEKISILLTEGENTQEISDVLKQETVSENPDDFERNTADMEKYGIGVTLKNEEYPKQEKSNICQYPKSEINNTSIKKHFKAPDGTKCPKNNILENCKQFKTQSTDQKIPSLSHNKPKSDTKKETGAPNKNITSKYNTPKPIKTGASPILYKVKSGERQESSKRQEEPSGNVEKPRRLSLPKASSAESKTSRRTHSAKTKETKKESESITNKSNKKNLTSSATQSSTKQTDGTKKDPLQGHAAGVSNKDATKDSAANAEAKKFSVKKTCETQSEKSVSSSSTKSSAESDGAAAKNQQKATIKALKEKEKPRWK